MLCFNELLACCTGVPHCACLERDGGRLLLGRAQLPHRQPGAGTLQGHSVGPITWICCEQVCRDRRSRCIGYRFMQDDSHQRPLHWQVTCPVARAQSAAHAARWRQRQPAGAAPQRHPETAHRQFGNFCLVFAKCRARKAERSTLQGGVAGRGACAISSLIVCAWAMERHTRKA